MYFGALFNKLCDHTKAVELFGPCKLMLTVGSQTSKGIDILKVYKLL